MAPHKFSGLQKPRKGGRRPKEEEQNEYLSPEEEEKRQTRRERNKLAARRCRERKMSLIEKLTQQVNELKSECGSKQVTVEQLVNEKKELLYLLDLHSSVCKLQSNLRHAHRDIEAKYRRTDSSNDHHTDAMEQYEVKLQQQQSASFNQPYPNRPDSLDFYTPKEEDTPSTSASTDFMFSSQPLDVHTGLTPSGWNGIMQVYPSNDSINNFNTGDHHIL